MSDSFAIAWTAAHQVRLSVGFFRQEYQKWVAISASSGSSQPRGQTCITCNAGGFFTVEPPGKHLTLTTIPLFEVSGLPQFFHLILKVTLKPHTLQRAILRIPLSPLKRMPSSESPPWTDCLQTVFSFCQRILKLHNLREETNQLSLDPKLLAQTLARPRWWWS